MLPSQYRDLQLIDYKEAWELQEKTLLAIQTARDKGEPFLNTLFFCEHPNVYTLGKNGSASNLLINEQFLASINATYYQTNRGGDITYHGPGQIVGYPILDLKSAGYGIKHYIYNLEEAIILTLKEYGLTGSRLDGATGVWLDPDVPGKARKICAIGVKAGHWITMHGFAFNVNTNLDYFRYINPCGFIDKGVTSLQIVLGKTIDFEETKLIVKNFLVKTLNLQLNPDGYGKNVDN